MKSRLCVFLITLSIMLSLGACTAGSTGPAADSGASGSSQTAGTSQSGSSGDSQSTDSPSGTDGGTSAPGDTASLPADACKAVLRGEAAFTSAEDGREYLLSDFLSRNSGNEGVYTVTHFTAMDLDGDQTPEAVLELSRNGTPEQFEVLHADGGTVYGYNFVYRGFEMLKEDGTFLYANSASDVGVQKILSFSPGSAETETFGYAQTDYSGGNSVISYFIDSAPAAKEAFDAFLNKQYAKTDAQWYEFSAENIEAFTGTAPDAGPADSPKYFGEWTVRKVLAYGVGTYGRDDAEKLIGTRLTFSADEADVLTDEPSDAPAVIIAPEYAEAAVTGADFQADYKMSFDTLGISAYTATLVQVKNPDGTVGVFLAADGGTLILIAGGTYFELAKP